MSTDRELLELAAKAAGLCVCEIYGHTDGKAYFVDLTEWNPLTDDGDALRLAVRLRLTISCERYDDSDYMTATPPHTYQCYDCLVDQCPAAATRRAIVLAAAEIGKTM